MLVRETNRKKVRWHAFGENLMDVEAWLRATPRTWRSNYSQQSGGGYRWDAGANWGRTLDYMRNGWEEGVKLISEALVGMPVPNDHIHKWEHDVSGFLPDVPRYLCGAPDNML